jgi:hypothetical protein
MAEDGRPDTGSVVSLPVPMSSRDRLPPAVAISAYRPAESRAKRAASRPGSQRPAPGAGCDVIGSKHGDPALRGADVQGPAIGAERGRADRPRHDPLAVKGGTNGTGPQHCRSRPQADAGRSLLGTGAGAGVQVTADAQRVAVGTQREVVNLVAAAAGQAGRDARVRTVNLQGVAPPAVTGEGNRGSIGCRGKALFGKIQRIEGMAAGLSAPGWPAAVSCSWNTQVRQGEPMSCSTASSSVRPPAPVAATPLKNSPRAGGVTAAISLPVTALRIWTAPLAGSAAKNPAGACRPGSARWPNGSLPAGDCAGPCASSAGTSATTIATTTVAAAASAGIVRGRLAGLVSSSPGTVAAISAHVTVCAASA